MAAMTWNTLTAEKTVSGSIKRWVNYDKVDPEEVIAEAEDWLAMELRTANMEAHDIIPISTGQHQVVIPDKLPRFLDPISVFLVGHRYLHYVARDEIDQIRHQDESGEISESIPCGYSIIGGGDGVILLDCAADNNYQLVVTYYRRPPPLSAAQQTNLYTEQYRALFKDALLAKAYQLPKDANAQQLHTTLAKAWMSQKKYNDDLILRAQEQVVRVH